MSGDGRRVRLAFVGCGAIAEMHRFAIEDSGAPIDIVAAIDLDKGRAEAMAGRTGAVPYESLDAALEDVAGTDGGGFDAVDIMVPHHRHVEVALQAFDAGLHVLLEKPIGRTPEEAERILASSRKAGTVFLCAENAQYWPEVVTAGRLLQDGAIGDVVTARACAFFPPLPDFYGTDDDDAVGPWRFDPAIAGGGIAIDTCSHWIRPLRMWFGEVEEVIGTTGQPFPGMRGESLVRALLRFESGVVAALDGLLTAAPLAPEVLFRITGSKGEITIDAAGTCKVYAEGRRGGEQVGEAAGYLLSFHGEFHDFAGAVLDGSRLAAPADHALGELRTALALYRSTESKRWETVWT